MRLTSAPLRTPLRLVDFPCSPRHALRVKELGLRVGNPNVGKSTLFNALTGARQTVRNAPGTTVEVFSGTWKSLGVRLIDTPGTYSLLPNSPDEEVVVDTLAALFSPTRRVWRLLPSSGASSAPS